MMRCPQCRSRHIEGPSSPAGYYDCWDCAHSWHWRETTIVSRLRRWLFRPGYHRITFGTATEAAQRDMRR